MAVPIAPAPPVTTAIRPCSGSSAVVMTSTRAFLRWPPGFGHRAAIGGGPRDPSPDPWCPASCSGVNVHAVAEVEADRFQDREGGGDREHVHGSQYAGVLLDDGRGGSIGHRVQVAPDR